MADDLNNLRTQISGLLNSFIIDSVAPLQEHINQEGHSIQHMQDIINNLSIMAEEFANPENWPAVPVPSKYKDAGGPASSASSSTA